MLATGLLVVIAVISLFEVVRRRWEQFRHFEKRGIPGPRPHFLWGHYMQLRDNHAFWLEKWTDEFGDTFGVFWGDRPLLVSTNLDLQQKVLIKEFSNFVNRAPLFALEQAHPMVRTMLVHEMDTRWKNLRSAITPSFSTARMKAMVPLIVKGIEQFEENLRKQGSNEFDVYPLLKRLTLDSIGRVAFGIDANSQADPSAMGPLLNAALQLVDCTLGQTTDLLANSFMFIGNSLSSLIALMFRFNLISHASTNFAIEVKKIVRARRKDGGAKRNDLLQTFLDANVEEGCDRSLMASGEGDDACLVTDNGKRRITLSEDQVIGNSVIMFVAGYETTSTGLACVLYCLAKHPDIQERLRHEIVTMLGDEGTRNADTDRVYTKVMTNKYLDYCTHEALRLFPPVGIFTTRRVTTTTELEGLKLEAGLSLLFPTYLANRSPLYWSDPLKYNPDRFADRRTHPLAYQTFGDGPRNCVGMRMALMSIKLTLSHILPRIRFTTKGEPVWKCKHILYQPEKVILRAELI